MPVMPKTAPSPSGKGSAGLVPEPVVLEEEVEQEEIPVESDEETRNVLYPHYEVKIKVEGYDGVLTAELARRLLGWETEEQYTARVIAADPSVKPEQAKFGEDFTLRDYDKRKVKCHHNSKNRPLSEPWAKALAQDILLRQWQFNMENIIISKYGTVLSGQHRLIGLVLAAQMWAGKNKARYATLWPEEPYIETTVALGAEETPEVMRTFDNTKPRLLSDNIYTSPLFSDLSNVDRGLCSRMLASAFNVMWKRTGESKRPGTLTKFTTSSTSIDYIERHPKLLDCVRHLFEENKERQVSILKLQPGECAGMMYLMASSDSDIDTYRHASPPSENQLDFTHWDLAAKFWSLIGNVARKDFVHVRHQLGLVLGGDEDGEGGLGSTAEKRAILCKAWQAFKEGRNPTAEDVSLVYDVDEDGSKTFIDTRETFGGIDLGEPRSSEEEEDEEAGAGQVVEQLTPEEEEARKKAEQERRAKEMKEKAEALLKNRAKLKGEKGNGQPTEPTPTITNEATGASRPMTRKEIEAEQTRKAKEADEQRAKEEAAAKKPKPAAKPAAKTPAKPAAKPTAKGAKK